MSWGSYSTTFAHGCPVVGDEIHRGPVAVGVEPCLDQPLGGTQRAGTVFELKLDRYAVLLGV
jgi:hypothetical protein